MVFEKLEILGFEFDPNWGFLSNWVQLMKLAYQIDVFGHYFCYSIMCDDQFVNIFQIDQVVFQILGFFVLIPLCSSQFCEFEPFGLNSLH